MFEKPTVEDFLALIDWHIAKALDNAGRSVAQVQGEFASKGAFNGSRRVMFSVAAARKEFDAGVEAVLGELRRTIRKTDLDPHVLRKEAEHRLRKFAVDAKAAANASGDFSQQLSAFDTHLNFALRQFDVGFSEPPDPEVPPVTNNIINVGDMTGSAIQQGSPNASQSVQVTLDADAARSALADFEAALTGSNLPASTLDEIKADIDTIRIQLSKKTPALAIIQESGRTLRNVVEGVAAGILTPSVIAAGPALWSALGLG